MTRMVRVVTTNLARPEYRANSADGTDPSSAFSSFVGALAAARSRAQEARYLGFDDEYVVEERLDPASEWHRARQQPGSKSTTTSRE